MTSRSVRYGWMLGTVLLLGGLAAAHEWVVTKRPDIAGRRAIRQIDVTTGADAGPGSLREALFLANGVDGPAHVAIRVAEIDVRSPLPPVANPHGTTIESADGFATVDAQRAGTNPILDLLAPRTTVRRLRLVGAHGPAVLVRASSVHLDSIEIVESVVGVHVSNTANALRVTGGRFEANEIGLRLETSDIATVVTENAFAKHRLAAIWGVGPAGAEIGGAGARIVGNKFDGDRFSLVVGNLATTIEQNEIVGAGEAAIYVAGRGATVRANRVRSGARVGILGADASGVVIARNEIDHNGAAGILLNSSQNAVLQENRTYRNGYGILVVLGEARSPNVLTENTVLANLLDGVALVGSSPILRGNRLLSNAGAGVRILDLVAARPGTRIGASPLLENNTTHGNGSDQPLRGEYLLP